MDEVTKFKVNAIHALEKAGVPMDKGPGCLQCGHDAFMMLGRLVLPAALPIELPREDDASKFACVAVICKKCSNVRLFSAYHLGVLDSPGDPVMS